MVQKGSAFSSSRFLVEELGIRSALGSFGEVDLRAEVGLLVVLVLDFSRTRKEYALKKLSMRIKWSKWGGFFVVSLPCRGALDLECFGVFW